MALKLKKTNNARKKQIYVFRGLKIKARVTNLQKYPKQGFFVNSWFMVTFGVKTMSINSLMSGGNKKVTRI